MGGEIRGKEKNSNQRSICIIPHLRHLVFLCVFCFFWLNRSIDRWEPLFCVCVFFATAHAHAGGDETYIYIYPTMSEAFSIHFASIFLRVWVFFLFSLFSGSLERGYHRHHPYYDHHRHVVDGDDDDHHHYLYLYIIARLSSFGSLFIRHQGARLFGDGPPRPNFISYL